MERWISEGDDGWRGMELMFRALAGEKPSLVQLGPDVLVPDRFEGTFLNERTGMRVELAIRVTGDGMPVVHHLHAECDDDRGIDRDRLRAVPIAELVRRACAETSMAVVDGRWTAGDKAVPIAESQVPRTRRSLTTEYLRQVADVYQEHDGPAPVQAVAAHFHLAPSTAAKHVMRARQEGLLPDTSPGVATNRDEEN